MYTYVHVYNGQCCSFNCVAFPMRSLHYKRIIVLWLRCNLLNVFIFLFVAVLQHSCCCFNFELENNRVNVIIKAVVFVFCCCLDGWLFALLYVVHHVAVIIGVYAFLNSLFSIILRCSCIQAQKNTYIHFCRCNTFK